MRDGRTRRTVMVVSLALAACAGPGDRAGNRTGGDAAVEAGSATGVPDTDSPVDGSVDPATALEPIPPVDDIRAPATTSPPPRIPNEGSAEVLRQEFLYQRPGPPGPLAAANGVPPVLLAPGVHTTDVLGIETTVALDEWWRLDGEDPGSFWLTRPSAPIGTLVPLVIFVRPLGLVEPARVHDVNLLPGQGTAPLRDLRAWLDDVDQLDLLATGPAIAGDRTGTWFDVDVDILSGQTNPDCSPGRCVNTWWSGARMFNARDLESIRYYEFPDPAGAIFVMVVAADDEWDEWIERAERLIRDTTFGPSAPHPVPPDLNVTNVGSEGAGTRFVEFPGLVIEPGGRTTVIQRPGFLFINPWGPRCCEVWTTIVRPVQTADGTLLKQFDDVVDVFVAAGLERLDDEVIGGLDATVFSGELTQPVLRYAQVAEGHDNSYVEWPGPRPGGVPQVKLWVLDSPIGWLVLAAQSPVSQFWFDEAIEQARWLGEAMSFDCASDVCDAAEE